jgi:pimeloyl-ACP methyl ester carboxylesterase
MTSRRWVAIVTVGLSIVLSHDAPEASKGRAGHYAKVAGYRMYYEEYGRGVPVVLLHGGLNTIAGSFARQIPMLMRRYHVIAVEQVGHGHTPDAETSFTYPQMADDTATLLRRLNVGPADVVGWSDGGIIALVLARRHPELVRRLVVSGVNVNLEGQRPEDVQSTRPATNRTRSDRQSPKRCGGSG